MQAYSTGYALMAGCVIVQRDPSGLYSPGACFTMLDLAAGGYSKGLGRLALSSPSKNCGRE